MLGSWERDIGLMINGLSRGKQKRKNTFSSFFSNRSFYLLDSRRWEFSHSICSEIQTVPIRTRWLCLLCRDKGHAHVIKSTGSQLEKHLLSKGISQKTFLTDDLTGDRYKKNLPSSKDNSLFCIRYVWQYCFPKNKNCSSSCVSSLSRKRIPHYSCNHSVYYSRVLLSTRWFSIRAWGVIFPDRPYWCLVSLIVYLIPRQTPTPSVIPTSLNQWSTSSDRLL
jgi:hypothetical protein